MRWALLFGGGRRDQDDDGPGAGAWLAALVAPLAAGLLQLALSRSREFLADETGARLTGDPEALARALLKLERGLAYVAPQSVEPATASLYIVNPLTSARSFLAIFSTHPPIEDRVERLRALAFEIGVG
jgi:heat shock protein HtpX